MKEETEYAVSTNDNLTHSAHQTSTASHSELISCSPARPSFTISPVSTRTDLTAIIGLFTAYAQSLNLDLSFQDFQTEMSSMPGKYSPFQGGELFLARRVPTTSAEPLGEPLGCVALRSLPSDINGPSPGVCEMKRLYVSPQARGLGLGKALARKVVQTAEALGYTEIRLDTLATMVAAQAMYRDLGFVDIKPYCFNPEQGTRFLALKLRGKQQND